VLIRKQRSYAEVYNDVDGDAVNLFRVLRSDRAGELIDALRLTPFARDEFVEASVLSDDPIERARRLVIRSFMGFGSNGHNIKRKTGFRANSNRSGTTPARDWLNYPDALATIVERLQGVIIENRDAAAVMTAHDSEETLHYVDPPYVPDTRSIKNKYDLKYAGGMYAHEMDEADHVALLQFVRGLAGTVILSGYAHSLYDEALSDWHRVERKHLADGARARTEVLWINRAANVDLLGVAA
jgi:DNA adenine methylase